MLTDTDTLPTIDAQEGVVSIAGSVIGSCIVLLILIVASVLVVVCFKRHKKTKKSINPIYVNASSTVNILITAYSQR